MPTSNDAYQQAEELIKKAIQNRSPVLRLNGLGLTELPLSLAEAQLDTLDLSANVLTEVPNWIGDFVQLDSLYLYGNRLTTLPEEFGKLAKRNLKQGNLPFVRSY